LAGALARLDYLVSHQTGSHIRLSTERNGSHHITIPDHDAMRIGTLSAILRDLCDHHQLSRQEILEALFS